MPDTDKMYTETKHAFGNSTGLDAAMASGTIDVYDQVFLNDKNVSGWVDADGAFHYDGGALPADLPVASPIGDAKGVDDTGKYPKGYTVYDVLKAMLNKRVPHTYVKPTIALTSNATKTVESGSTLAPALSASFTQNEAGALTKLAILKGNTEIATGTTNTLTHTAEEFVIGDETVGFKATASYEQGPILQDNLGDDSPSGRIEAGSITSSVVNFTGKRYLFYQKGIGSAPEINSDTIRALTSKVFAPVTTIEGGSWTMDAGTAWVIIAVPEGKKVTEIINIDAAQANILEAFTQTTVQVADARGGAEGLKNYTVYSYVPAIAFPTAQRLNVKIG